MIYRYNLFTGHQYIHILFGLNKTDDEQLSYDDADEHSERIDRSITDACMVARRGVAGIVERHGVCHAAADDTADSAPVVIACAECYYTDYHHRQEGD